MMRKNKYLKYVFLTILVFQTSLMVLLTRISRKTDHGSRYFPSTLIFCSEIVKLITLFIVTLYQIRSFSKSFSYIKDEIFLKKFETIKLFVPAFLYSIQNNLIFVAITYLDSLTYQVFYQLKILVTALCSVWLLNRRLSLIRWLSLFILIIGVTIVEWEKGNSFKKGSQDISERLTGLSCVIIASFTSGFSGVYFENIVKTGRQSLLIRNFQLCCWSLIIIFMIIYFQDWQKIQNYGFFHGYTPLTLSIVFIQGLGGLVIGLIMKYADNILKAFATSISIIVSSLASYYLLDDFKPSLMFIIGALTVISATLMYSR